MDYRQLTFTRTDSFVPQMQHTMKGMCSISFYLRTEATNKHGLTPLYLKIGLHRKRIERSMKIYLDSKYWDEAKQCVTTKHDQYMQLNQLLQNTRSHVYEIINSARYRNIPLTLNYIKNMLDEKSDQNFYMWWLKDIESRLGDIVHASYKCHLYQRDKMMDFNRSITFHDINVQFLEKFRSWMIKRGDAPNTIHKMFQTLRAYLVRAKSQKLITENPFDEFKSRRIPTKRSYLSEEEIMQLEQLADSDLPIGVLATYAWFMFGIYTGLRHSDLYKFDPKCIQNDTIHLVPQKTKKHIGVVKIPLIPQAKKWFSFIQQNNLVLQCNQKCNMYLKSIAHFAEIKQNLTFHMSRHTFGTMCAEKGVNPLVLQRYLGHMKFETTQVYIHLSDQSIYKESLKLYPEQPSPEAPPTE